MLKLVRRSSDLSSQYLGPRLPWLRNWLAHHNRKVRHYMAHVVGYASTAVTSPAAAALVETLLEQAALNGVKHAAERHGAIAAIGQVVGRNLRVTQQAGAEASTARGLTPALLQRCVGLLVQRLVQRSADACLAACESLAVLCRLCELPMPVNDPASPPAVPASSSGDGNAGSWLYWNSSNERLFGGIKCFRH